MKKIALVILVLLAGAPVFAKQHTRKKKKQPTNNIMSVSMRRTPCYGRCPDYTVEITKDGMATYTATRFNPDTGVFTKNIGAKKAMEIIGKFQTYRVDTCTDGYRNRTDLPGINLTVKYKDSTKMIRNANLGPEFLKELATAIEEAGKKNDDSWKKVETPATKK